MTKYILVPVDLEKPASLDIVLPEAIEAARYRGASLQLFTVLNIAIGMFPYVQRGSIDDACDSAQQRLQAVVKDRLPDDVTWEAVAEVGQVAKTIVTKARDLPAEIVIMASHDPKTIDLVLGSVAEQVIRRAHCSVLVIR